MGSSFGKALEQVPTQRAGFYTFESKRENRGHILVIHNESGFKADIYFTGREDVQLWGMQNRVKAQIEGFDYWFASPEYVIIKKLEYYKAGQSEKHTRDIKAMLELSGNSIDCAVIKKHANLLGLSTLLPTIWN